MAGWLKVGRSRQMSKELKNDGVGVLRVKSNRIKSRVDGNTAEEQHDLRTMPRILIVENEIVARERLEFFYTSNGYNVEIATSEDEALSRVEKGNIDLVIIDVELPGINRAETAVRLQLNDPRLPVVAIGYSSIDQFSHEFRHNVSGYVMKPFSGDVIQQVTKAALEKARVFSESNSLRRSLNDTEGEFGLLLSKTPAMHQVFESIRMVAPTNMTVLLEGEAGTGKELIANAIHHRSFRRNRPFISVNCAGFPDSLLETELFGHKEGGLFGTAVKTPGKIKLADGGTLFLDEIEAMAPFVQSKFMRVLEDCNTVHLGGQQTLDSDIRVIAASKVPLQDLVGMGKMRTDMYYRINVIPIHLLPLRERADDIPLLVDEFLSRNVMAKQKGIMSVSRDALSRLIQHRWPGNLRELQNVLEKAVVLTKGSVIEVVDLPVAKTSVS
jgi:two-component system, NtrC family, response regulator HydG